MKLRQLILEEQKEADLVLIRGVPGSGKTTYVKNNLKNYKHFEADDFFMVDGEYKYDPSKMYKAHQQCFRNTEKALKNGDKVAVSNTFVKKKELQPYINLAKRLGKKVSIIRINKDFKNIHGVPNEVVQRMREKFQAIDNEKIKD